jgi:hypothetical protein
MIFEGVPAEEVSQSSARHLRRSRRSRAGWQGPSKMPKSSKIPARAAPRLPGSQGTNSGHWALRSAAEGSKIPKVSKISGLFGSPEQHGEGPEDAGPGLEEVRSVTAGAKVRRFPKISDDAAGASKIPKVSKIPAGGDGCSESVFPAPSSVRTFRKAYECLKGSFGERGHPARGRSRNSLGPQPRRR